jgi:hypothetical protein
MKLISSLPNRVNVRSSVKFLSITSLFLSGVFLGAIDAVFAAENTCNNVNMTFQNKSPAKIKIMKVAYNIVSTKPGINKKAETINNDYITKITGQIIQPGIDISEIMDYSNLRPVNISESVSTLITYSKELSNGQFSQLITMKAPAFTCSNGVKQTAVLK